MTRLGHQSFSLRKQPLLVVPGAHFTRHMTKGNRLSSECAPRDFPSLTKAHQNISCLMHCRRITEFIKACLVLNPSTQQQEKMQHRLSPSGPPLTGDVSQRHPHGTFVPAGLAQCSMPKYITARARRTGFLLRVASFNQFIDNRRQTVFVQTPPSQSWSGRCSHDA